VYLVIEIYMISGAQLSVPVLERAIRSGAVLFFVRADDFVLNTFWC